MVWWKKQYQKGLTYVHQLLNENEMISFQEANERFGLSMLQYNSLKTAIPKEWRVSSNHEIETNLTGNYHRLIGNKHMVKKVYGSFIEDFSICEIKLRKWEIELQMEIDTDTFLVCFKDLYKVSNVPKYRSFQYRLLQRAIVTNIHLKH